jgi:SNF2 family DNA or RNA helicase
VQFIKARQAVSCPIIFGVHSDAKLERVKEVIKEAFEDGKSVVVFAWFNATINHYIATLSALFQGSVIGVTETTGNVQDKVSEFQNAEEPKVIIGTIGKLGTSFTITKADIVIFVDKHVMWSQYEQAYMRVWRQGQTKNVVILNIMAKDTIDERLEFLIARGKSHSEQVVDGINRPEEYLQKQIALKDIF